MFAARMKPIRLGRAHFAFLVVIVLLVLPIVIIMVSYPSIYNLYLEFCVARDMHSRYGFTAEWRDIQGGAWYVITSIHPDGSLAKMGFEVGDVPLGHHGGLQAFYGSLQEADEGRDTEVDVMRATDLAKGTYTKRKIVVRSAACRPVEVPARIRTRPLPLHQRRHYDPAGSPHVIHPRHIAGDLGRNVVRLAGGFHPHRVRPPHSRD